MEEMEQSKPGAAEALPAGDVWGNTDLGELALDSLGEFVAMSVVPCSLV